MISKKHITVHFLLLNILIIMFLSSHILAQKIIVEEEKTGAVKLWLEAEAGSIASPMKVHDNNDASGGQFIEVLSGNNNTENAPEDGQITYEFTVKNAFPDLFYFGKL